MTGPNITGDDYRAGYLAGQADRQGEVDWLENEADRLYRLAYGDECRVQDLTVTRAELEQRRALSEPPVEVTRRDTLASWGIETPPTDTPAAEAANENPSTPTGPTNRTSRSLNDDVKAPYFRLSVDGDLRGGRGRGRPTARLSRSSR
ncbi:hypothetical protein [Rathayibacter sp. AY2B5]|uniref:hypothetical protein n=1 Tax=Rathayibacter sp. AY2B5 TaxID=2080570 RepID=UPI000CE92522|nr:hypothetical protein [Rathayibacter sp. AY2B5]PPG40980.1 hypothetical protein C5C30_09280 [Rathayibacter sp. AY2B5]